MIFNLSVRIQSKVPSDGSPAADAPASDSTPQAAPSGNQEVTAPQESRCPITRTINKVSGFFAKITGSKKSSSPQASQPQGSLFDGPMALKYSCYTGITKVDQSVVRTEAPLYIIPEGKLWPDTSDHHPEAVVQFFHDQFRALAMHKMFPCIGARTSMHHGLYRFGLYPSMGSIEAAAALGRDLRRFVSEHKAMGDFTSFIAVFRGPAIDSEAEYEELLWKQLQLLHDHDEPFWDPNYAYSPEHPEFSFSFAQRAFFIVGFNPVSSRLARNYVYPAIAFNPELQIANLRTTGQLEKWEHDIRQADIRLQGSMNPSITTELGKRVPEARIYSGKANPPDQPWKCPFRQRPDVKDPKAP